MPFSIRVENVSKRYQVRSAGEASYQTLKDTIAREVKRFLRPQKKGAHDDDFWALRDIDFEIQPGELIGLIGRNGSGKSTLLKVLAQVTKPTTGKVTLYGRVGSLLEVGTGFHPELTGRENIFMSGAILGMSRAEIIRSFDEIIEFSETGAFLDMPVKRYSSGMYLRLAFSVAAHLNPEILLIDEALSVGDASFQKKCLAKMKTFSSMGATVIFVSHHMGLVGESCQRCLLLDKGRLLENGPAKDVVQKYLYGIGSPINSRVQLDTNPEAEKHGIVLREVRLNRDEHIRHGERFEIEIHFEVLTEQDEVSVGFGFSNSEGVRLLSCDSDATGKRLDVLEPGRYSIKAALPTLDLSPGVYLLDAGIRHGNSIFLDYRPACMQVEVLAQDETPGFLLHLGGAVRPDCEWDKSPSRK
jgi:lipopolysaccharide transport system ATP-binding protein